MRQRRVVKLQEHSLFSPGSLDYSSPGDPSCGFLAPPVNIRVAGGKEKTLFKVSERTCKLHALPYLLSIRKSPPGCRCVGFRPALHQQSPKAGGTSATLIKRAPAGSCARG